MLVVVVVGCCLVVCVNCWLLDVVNCYNNHQKGLLVVVVSMVVCCYSLFDSMVHLDPDRWSVNAATFSWEHAPDVSLLFLPVVFLFSSCRLLFSSCCLLLLLSLLFVCRVWRLCSDDM